MTIQRIHKHQMERISVTRKHSVGRTYDEQMWRQFGLQTTYQGADGWSKAIYTFFIKTFQFLKLSDHPAISSCFTSVSVITWEYKIYVTPLVHKSLEIEPVASYYQATKKTVVAWEENKRQSKRIYYVVQHIFFQCYENRLKLWGQKLTTDVVKMIISAALQPQLLVSDTDDEFRWKDSQPDCLLKV